MRGKKTSAEKIEEIKALSIVFEHKDISRKTGVSLRTVYAILARKDNPVIEAKREEKRLEIIDEVFTETKAEISKQVTILKKKEDMLLEGLTPEKAQKARTTELTTAYGTLFDKRRLLTNQPTEILDTQSVIYDMSEFIKLCTEALKEDRNEGEGEVHAD